MQEESEEKEIKQQYLINEIIERNYDPRLFTLHCELTKEANLDLWTLDELRLCVQDFKQKYKPGQSLEQIRDPGTVTIMASKKRQSELSSIPALEIQISEPRIMESGLFSSEFAVYDVKTLPFEWEVQREFSDFVWLRKMVLNDFPGIFVPPLPMMKTRGDISEKTLYLRQYCLKKFMKVLVSHPLILREEPLRVFLKQNNVEAFKEFMASCTCEKIEDILLFPSLDGVVVGDLIDHSDSVKALKNYYQKSAALMKKLKEKAYIVIVDLENISDSLMRLVNTLGKLSEIQNALSFTGKYEKLYRALKKTFEKILESQRNKIEIVNEHLTMFFKYSSLEQETLKNFVEYNESFAILYRKALLKNVQSIDRIREFYAYFNAQNNTETNRVNEFGSGEAFKNFYEFSIKQAEVVKDLRTAWEGLLKMQDES